MSKPESVLEAATRIKANMEALGYTPSMEEVVESVEIARAKDMNERAKRMHNNQELAGYTGTTVEQTLANLMVDYEERTALARHHAIHGEGDKNKREAVIRDQAERARLRRGPIQ